MKDLKDTVAGMQSADYKERFIAEYEQTKIRYEKLKNFCDKIASAQLMGVEPPKHDCPLALLREQQKYMELYLLVLEKRAIIECIDIRNKVLDEANGELSVVDEVRKENDLMRRIIDNLQKRLDEANGELRIVKKLADENRKDANTLEAIKAILSEEE